jgi:hypothetical protein
VLRIRHSDNAAHNAQKAGIVSAEFSPRVPSEL